MSDADMPVHDPDMVPWSRPHMYVLVPTNTTSCQSKAHTESIHLSGHIQLCVICRLFENPDVQMYDQAVTLRRGGILGSRKRWLRGTGTVLSTDLEWRCVWDLEGAANIVMYVFGFLYQVVFLLCVRCWGCG